MSRFKWRFRRVLFVTILLGLACACDQGPPDQLANLARDDGFDSSAQLSFSSDGVFRWQGQSLALGDSITRWRAVFGHETRLLDKRLYIWDELGLKVFTDRSSALAQGPAVDDLTYSVEIHFVDWATYDPILFDPDDPGGLTLGYFKKDFEYGGVIIDHQTSIDQFRRVNRLYDSISRPNDYRHIIDSNDRKIAFSISAAGDGELPSRPKKIDIYLLK